MRPDAKQYDRVGEEWESISQGKLNSHRSFYHSRKCTWALLHILLLITTTACCLAILFITGVKAVGARPYSSAPDICRERYTESVRSCGNSTTEARAFGCQFDLLSAAWLPEECQDRELTEEFRAAGPWKYFADSLGRVELREEELSERTGGENGYWTSRRWHTVHCAFQWRKMHRSIERGARMEDALRDYTHTMHCGEMFLMEGPWDELITEITVEFLSC
jgi:hypothetical protein